MRPAKAGERTIFGSTWTECGARAYNAMSERIAQFEEAGLPVPDSLLNGRHNIYVSANMPARP